jgi:hypothetical protein
LKEEKSDPLNKNHSGIIDIKKRSVDRVLLVSFQT